MQEEIIRILPAVALVVLICSSIDAFGRDQMITKASSYGLAICVAPAFKSIDVESNFDEIVAKHVVLISFDQNGGQFRPSAIQRWAQYRSTSLAYIQPGKP